MIGSTRDTSILRPAADNFMAFALIAAVVLWSLQRHVPPSGIEDLLKLRLTVLHVFCGVVFVSLWRFCFDAVDIYSSKRSAAFLGYLTGCVAMVGLVGVFLSVQRLDGSRSRILFLVLLATLAYQALRWLILACCAKMRNLRTKNVIILGSGRRASKAWRELRTREYESKTVLGFVDDRSPALMAPDIAGRYLGRTDELSDYLFRNPVDELIVASPIQSEYAMTQRAITIAEAAGIRVLCLDDVFTLAYEKTRGQQASLLREIVPPGARRIRGRPRRRFIDSVVSSLSLALFFRMRSFSKEPSQKL